MRIVSNLAAHTLQNFGEDNKKTAICAVSVMFIYGSKYNY